MIPIEEIAPVVLPKNWQLLPEEVSIQGKIFPIWPKNGRAYLLEEETMKTQVVISVNESNNLHVSISNSLKNLSIEESMEYISDIIPSYFVDFIPQEVINDKFLKANIKKRVTIGKGFIQHYEKQL